MSLAVDPHGDALVIDQVNNRLVRIGPGGAPNGTIKIGDGAQDVAVGTDFTIAVLDRLVDKNVTLYGADGRALGTLDFVGSGIAEGGAITGIFVDGNSPTAAHGILLLDTDRFSTLYVATLGSAADGSDVEQLTCVALEDGRVIRSVPVTANTLPEETFREFAVLEDGGVLHTKMSDEGVRYVRYDCR